MTTAVLKNKNYWNWEQKSDTSSLVTTTALNTKISEVENKIPDQIMLNVLLLKLTDNILPQD